MGEGISKNPSIAKLLVQFLVTFLGFSLVGYLFSVLSPEGASKLVSAFASRLGELPDSKSRMFLLIFLNNSTVAALSVISGLMFGLGPWVIMAFNGFFVGVVVGFVTDAGKYSIQKALLALIPHGIVEIPAIALACVGGILWYREIIAGEGSGQEKFKKGAKKALRLLALSILLLLVAAFIEAYITPSVAGLE